MKRPIELRLTSNGIECQIERKRRWLGWRRVGFSTLNKAGISPCFYDMSGRFFDQAVAENALQRVRARLESDRRGFQPDERIRTPIREVFPQRPNPPPPPPSWRDPGR